jgi:hypothetical protein
VDLGILKFGTRSLDFRSAVILGETGQMCPDNRKFPPKGVADKDKVMENGKSASHITLEGQDPTLRDRTE